jgi:hypothetical protein
MELNAIQRKKPSVPSIMRIISRDAIIPPASYMNTAMTDMTHT